VIVGKASTPTVNVTVALVDELILDRRFQPRTYSSPDALFDEAEVERMLQGGIDAGYPSGWAPERYDLVRAWVCPEDGRLYIVEGFHRTALARRCGIVEIPALLIRCDDEATALDLARRSNVKTLPLDPVGEARAYRADHEAGRSWDVISRIYDRRSPGYYDRRAAIAYLLPRIQDEVRRRVVSVEYAEAIGEVARDGATPGLQELLAEVAVKTKARIELFRRMARAMLARQRSTKIEGDGEGLLFDLSEITDAGATAASEIMVEAARKAAIRDGWAELKRAGVAQVRRIERAGMVVPDDLPALIASLDRFRAEADRAVGEVLGEKSSRGHAGAGVTGTIDAKPYLKWVGSKATEAPILVPVVRERMGDGGRYIEPFAGSAAMLFAIAPEAALVGDINQPLMVCHRAVRDRPIAVAEALAGLVANGFGKEAFLAIRAMEPTDPVEVAAWVIYLNRTGFNGLWRVNSSGRVNVPWGDRKSPRFPTRADLVRAAEVLGAADLVCSTWQPIVAEAVAGDVIFADPPYPGTFAGYAKKTDEVDPIALARALSMAADRGVGVVATLPDTPGIRTAFEGWCDEILIPRRNRVSAKAEGRKAINQIAFLSRTGGGR